MPDGENCYFPSVKSVGVTKPHKQGSGLFNYLQYLQEGSFWREKNICQTHYARATSFKIFPQDFSRDQ
jgi:hypothetical protein